MKKSAVKNLACLLVVAVLVTGVNAVYAVDHLEKEDLKFGFIKLTDMAPLAIAYETGKSYWTGSLTANWTANWTAPTCWPASPWARP